MSEEFRKSAQRWAVFEEYCGTLNASIYSLSSSLATKENVSSEDKLTQVGCMRLSSKTSHLHVEDYIFLSNACFVSYANS